MSTRNDNEDMDSGADAGRASELYRSLPRELAPPHLDSAVLSLAVSEAGRSSWVRWIVPWLRPAAFAVTVGLCLAIVLEINESSTTAKHLLEDGAGTEIPAAVLDDFASAATDSSERIRAIGETAAERELPADSAANSYSEPPAYCDEKQSATPESWLQCIEALRLEGRVTEAEAERLRFRQAYPDLTTPGE